MSACSGQMDFLSGQVEKKPSCPIGQVGTEGEKLLFFKYLTLLTLQTMPAPLWTVVCSRTSSSLYNDILQCPLPAPPSVAFSYFLFSLVAAQF